MAQLNFQGAQALDGGVVRYTFGVADANAVVAAVAAYFAARGYALEEGAPHDGMYGTGSAVGRALLGGFVPRYKFKVAVYSGEGVALLDFSKGMSGAVGGALGAAKMAKEFTAIQEELKAL